MWTIFKIFIEFVTILFYVLDLCQETCEILALWPGIEPTPPALEGEILTTGKEVREVQYYKFFIFIKLLEREWCSLFIHYRNKSKSLML